MSLYQRKFMEIYTILVRVPELTKNVNDHVVAIQLFWRG